MAPRTSSTPAPKKRRGASQARASETKEEQVVWYGGQNAHQDVCIRLVRDDTINNEVDGGRTLARLMVHSSRLETCGTSYFAAALSQRWASNRKRSSDELTFQVTFHVDGDVRLYTDCFSRMYNPFLVGFKSVEYSLQLLAVATHLAYYDLMSSICVYLASVHPWSDEDEMRIRSSVSSEDFPRGHARDVLELLERSLTRDDLRPLITRCMSCFKSGQIRKSSIRSAKQARDLLGHLLVTARGQEQSLNTLTFEQEAVCVINDEFKHLVVEANGEVETADTMQGNPGLINRLAIIHQVLGLLLVTRMADEAAKCFGQYTSFPKLIEEALTSEHNDDDVTLADDMIWTALTMVTEICRFNVHLQDSRLRDATFLNWLPFLDWVRRNVNEVLGWRNMKYREEFGHVQQALLLITPSSEDLKEIVARVLAP